MKIFFTVLYCFTKSFFFCSRSWCCLLAHKLEKHNFLKKLEYEQTLQILFYIDYFETELFSSFNCLLRVESSKKFLSREMHFLPHQSSLCWFLKWDLRRPSWRHPPPLLLLPAPRWQWTPAHCGPEHPGRSWKKPRWHISSYFRLAKLSTSQWKQAKTAS